MRIGILYGGSSPERDVSLNSGRAIIKACNDLGYQVLALDPRAGLEPLIPELKNIDLVFNGLHGGDGENGVVSGFLDNLGVKYTGSDKNSSILCIDKHASKELVLKEEILTPDWISLSLDDKLIENNLKYPLVVKPNSEGSTIGLTIIKDSSKLTDAVNLARKFDKKILLESFIAGREITVTVVGDRAYPIIEIIPKHELYDYECKYIKGMTSYVCPAEIQKTLSSSIQSIALDIHNLLGCRHYSRVDFRLDKEGNPWFLEINTLPGMTETSLVPKSAATLGINFNSLIQKIIDEALKI